MSERLKWFKAARITTDSLRNAAKEMLQWKYSDEAGWGFLLSETRRDSLQGRFIERFILKEDIVDPTGKALHYERILFQETHFSLQSQFPHLELRNSPRSVSTFLNQLGRAFDFDIALVPIEIDLVRFVAALSRKFENVTVSRMTVSDIKLSEGVEAKCAIVGEKDVREHVQTITGRRKFRVTSIGLVFSMNEVELRSEIASDGRMTVATDLADDTRANLRQVLKEAAGT
jgi:hypothetical protein